MRFFSFFLSTVLVAGLLPTIQVARAASLWDAFESVVSEAAELKGFQENPVPNAEGWKSIVEGVYEGRERFLEEADREKKEPFMPPSADVQLRRLHQEKRLQSYRERRAARQKRLEEMKAERAKEQQQAEEQKAKEEQAAAQKSSSSPTAPAEKMPSLAEVTELFAQWSFDRDNADKPQVYESFGRLPGEMRSLSVGEGRVEQAVFFDGTNSEQIRIPDAPEIQNHFRGGGAFSLWMKPKGDGQKDVGRILDKGKAGDFRWRMYTHSEDEQGYLKISFDQAFSESNGKWTTRDAIVPLDEWSFVFVMYNSDDPGYDPRIYLNGRRIPLAESSVPVGEALSDVGSDLYLGNRDGGGIAYQGGLDEMRLYELKNTAWEVVEPLGEEPQAEEVMVEESEAEEAPQEASQEDPQQEGTDAKEEEAESQEKDADAAGKTLSDEADEESAQESSRRRGRGQQRFVPLGTPRITNDFLPDDVVSSRQRQLEQEAALLEEWQHFWDMWEENHAIRRNPKSLEKIRLKARKHKGLSGQ